MKDPVDSRDLEGAGCTITGKKMKSKVLEGAVERPTRKQGMCKERLELQEMEAKEKAISLEYVITGIDVYTHTFMHVCCAYVCMYLCVLVPVCNMHIVPGYTLC